ncbi:MAG TPA: hypothetical protein VG319_15060, partial [Polyangia bacterium]|nr:hypothetical protein [Polyangia bacterium]
RKARPPARRPSRPTRARPTACERFSRGGGPRACPRGLVVVIFEKAYFKAQGGAETAPQVHF